MAARIDRTYLVNCLVAGFSQVQVAEALGVTPSAVTQVIQADTSIMSEVSSKRAAKMTRASTIDERLDEIEEKAWKLMDRNLALLADPMKILKVAMAANAAKRRGSATPSQEAPTGATVALSLPVHLHQHFHFDGNNQAIAVGDTPLVTMPATQARKLLAERNTQQLSAEVNHEAHSW